MRTILSAIAAGCIASIASADNAFDGHKAVRVHVETDAELQSLLALTDDVWSHHLGIGADIDVRLSPQAFAALQALNLPHTVMLEDVGAAITAERLAIQQNNLIAGLDFFDNYHPADQIRTYVEDLALKNPTLIQVDDIGTSIENRDIWSATVTGPGNPAGRIDIAITGCQHAREWISPATVTYIIDQLVTQYGADDHITDVMDNVVFHFVPIVNIDGYIYTWADEDNRLWRKNRNPDVGNGCVGVDLNRNWSYEWGGEGSSGDPCNDVYRGASPLSEPESTDVATYLASIPDLIAHIDFHSYGQLVLSPWGYTSDLPDIATLFDDLNSQLQQAIFDTHGAFYVAGPGYDTLYPAAGLMPDFVHGSLGAWSWTIELRPDSDFGGGFILPPGQILPTAEESLSAVLTLADNALEPAKIIAAIELPPFLPSGQTFPVAVDVYEVSDQISSVTLNVSTNGDDFDAIPMTPQGQFTYVGDVPAQSCGTIVSFYVEVVTAGAQSVTLPSEGANAPFSLEVFDQVILFEDHAEQDNGWAEGVNGDTATTGIWERANPQATSAQPGDDHTPNGTDCYVTGATAGQGVGGNDIDGGFTTLLTPVFSALDEDNTDPYVVYWRWYSNDQGAAPNSDSMPISISNNAGQSWTLLEDVEENANAWVEARFRIADYLAPTDQMRLRFVASDLGDGSVVEAAIDDLTVESLTCDCPTGADFNGDGNLNILDFVAYQSAFQAQDPCADINADGNFNILDFVAFQSLFQGG